MRAMIGWDTASGAVRLTLAPENDTERYIIARKFASVTRADVVKAQIDNGSVDHPGSNIIGHNEDNVIIRLVGQSYSETDGPLNLRRERQSER